MKRNDPISHLMSTELITIQMGQSISEVRQLLEEHKIHHMPVLDGKRLVGIMSTTDLVRLSFGAWGGDARSMDAYLDHEFKLEGVMQTDITTLKEGSTVRDAARGLSSGRFHSLPVVDNDKNLVGMVTTTDLITYLLAQY